MTERVAAGIGGHGARMPQTVARTRFVASYQRPRLTRASCGSVCQVMHGRPDSVTLEGCVVCGTRQGSRLCTTSQARVGSHDVICFMQVSFRMRNACAGVRAHPTCSSKRAPDLQTVVADSGAWTRVSGSRLDKNANEVRLHICHSLDLNMVNDRKITVITFTSREAAQTLPRKQGYRGVFPGNNGHSEGPSVQQAKRQLAQKKPKDF